MMMVMPADQMLAKLLRALQHSYAPEESSRSVDLKATLALFTVLIILAGFYPPPRRCSRH